MVLCSINLSARSPNHHIVIDQFNRHYSKCHYHFHRFRLSSPNSPSNKVSPTQAYTYIYMWTLEQVVFHQSSQRAWPPAAITNSYQHPNNLRIIQYSTNSVGHYSFIACFSFYLPLYLAYFLFARGGACERWPSPGADLLLHQEATAQEACRWRWKCTCASAFAVTCRSEGCCHWGSVSGQ